MNQHNCYILTKSFNRNWLLGRVIKRFVYGTWMKQYKKCANQRHPMKKVCILEMLSKVFQLCKQALNKFIFNCFSRINHSWICYAIESVSTDIIFEGIPIKSKVPQIQKISTSSVSLQSTNQTPTITTLQSEITKPMPKFSLQHEFSILNTNIPHIDVEVLDAVKRHAMIRVSLNGHVIMLQVGSQNFNFIDKYLCTHSKSSTTLANI